MRQANVPAREQAQVISAKSRVDRVTDRALREAQRKTPTPGHRRPSRSDVDAYKVRIAALTEAHRIEFEPIDWDEIVECGPVAPDISRDSESAAAKRALMEYRPSVMDNLLGREQERRRELMLKVGEAAKADTKRYAHAKAFTERHNRLLALAPEVRALKLHAIANALKANDIVQALGDVLEGLSLTAQGPGRIVAVVDLPDFVSLPDKKCGLGPTGPSYTEASMADRCQMQLTCAAALILRVAAEVLQVAPINTVEVVARLCRHDDPDGADLQTVAHVEISLAAMKEQQLTDADPAQILTGLGARLDWSDARGLAPIEGEFDTRKAGRVAA